MIAKIRSTVLLMGAGFTKSFGGYLADEMWAAIFNQPEVKKYRKIRDCLLKNMNFEDAYNDILEAAELADEEREAFSDALGRAYDEMDGAIREFTSMARAACVDFLPLFAGSGEEERGFIFTVNQDLFLERFLSNGDSRTRAWIDMPGLDCALWFSNKPPRFESDIEYLFTPHDAQQVTQLQKSYWTTPGAQLSYFKLHGSDNWFDSKSGLMRIIGRQKSRVIENYPLLTWYQSVFGEVLRRAGIYA